MQRTRFELHYDRQQGWFLVLLAVLLVKNVAHAAIWPIALLVLVVGLRVALVNTAAVDHFRKEFSGYSWFFFLKRLSYQTVAVDSAGQVVFTGPEGRRFSLLPYAFDRTEWQGLVAFIGEIDRFESAGGRFRVVLGRDASDELWVTIPDLPGDAYAPLAREVMARFGLETGQFPVIGLDEVFLECGRDGVLVGLEWDNWSGFIVVAKDTAAEPLVLAIHQYLQEHYGGAAD